MTDCVRSRLLTFALQMGYILTQIPHLESEMYPYAQITV